MKFRSKMNCITTALMTGFLLMTASCASVFTQGELQAMRGVRTFRIAGLDAETARVIRSGAYWATQHGYPTYESPTGSIAFAPPEDGVRTRFFSMHVAQFAHLDVVDRDMMPGHVPVMERHDDVVWMRWLPGGVDVSDGDMVGVVEDLFIGGR